MKPENKIAAHNIRLLRKQQKLTQTDFGIKYGSHQKNIWWYESGTKPPTEFLLRLSQDTGISLETLLTIRLTVNKKGEIINLPGKDKEIQELRRQLKQLRSNLEKAIGEFFDGMETVNRRIDKLEKSK